MQRNLSKVTASERNKKTKYEVFVFYSRAQRNLSKVTANEWNNKTKYEVFAIPLIFRLSYNAININLYAGITSICTSKSFDCTISS